jgi:serine/threonine-protein kinase
MLISMIGTRVGHWIIERELGHGGMGRVYLAHADPQQGAEAERAAVKVLAASLDAEPGFLHRFQREIAILKQLDHPHIVKLFDSGVQDGLHYFVMEYVDGQNLDQLLTEQGRLPWPAVLDIALQVCPALKHAHDRGVVHRDIKPSNLLRTATGTIKLTDFGIARVFAATHLTATGGVLGTAEYLSPEQAVGKTATRRSDLYSLGVVLYTLLTGRTPFVGQVVDLLHKHRFAQFERPQRLVVDLPWEVDQVVSQLLEKEPSARPADAYVLQRQLESIQRKLARKTANTKLDEQFAQTLLVSEAGTAGEQGVGHIRLPGPATLMSRLMRRELEDQNRGGPLSRLLNRPSLLVPLFLLTVGLLVWSLWPASAEHLYQRITTLMASEDHADWFQAAELMDQLDRKYPDNAHHEELKGFRQRIEAEEALRHAKRAAEHQRPSSEAQWFYVKALRLYQEGKANDARQVWRALIQGFRGIEAEQPWVVLAEEQLREPGDGTLSADRRWAPVQNGLDRACQLRDAGKMEDARAVWQALESLYRDDPSAGPILERIKQDQAAAPRP